MAKTLRTYRSTDRSPRFSTNLDPFSKGMYLTKQTVPEGYVKALVNYDIDDTGSCLRPRPGRAIQQTFDYVSRTLGPTSLTDYIYAYNNERTEVEDIKDVVMSLGIYDALSTLIPNINVGSDHQGGPHYVSHLTHTIDNNIYDDDGNLLEERPTEVKTHAAAWGLYCNKGEENFNKVGVSSVGYLTARTLKNSYAFNKPFLKDVGRPVYTVLNNELIAFTGTPIKYTEVVSNANMSGVASFSAPALTKLQLVHNQTGTYDLIRKVLEPKKLNTTEAAATGYNILSEEPYVFTDVAGGSLAILGIIPYASQTSTLPIFVPSVGETIALRVYYQHPNNSTPLKYKVEYLNTTVSDSNWQTLKDWTEFGNAGTPLWHEFTPLDTRFLVRVTIREGDNTITEYATTEPYDTTSSKRKNLQNRFFDLSKAKGLISWQGCVGAYGIVNAKDTIFFSDVEDPSYFPFPNNTISFDNEILAVHNYLDFLLVVTADSVWLVAPGASIRNAVQKRILSNIHIPEIDAINLVVLKDQIFFKTDSQFYVLKPNRYTGDSTNLKNYTNSLAIANLTTNFTEEVLNLINKVYRNIWFDKSKELNNAVRFDSFDVLDTKSTTFNEEVHYVYTLVPKIGEEDFGKLDLHLVYNSMTRSWRLYFKAVGGEDVYYTPVVYRNKQSGAFYDFFPHSLESSSRLSIVKLTDDTLDDNFSYEDWNLTEKYNNFNYLDTGDVTLDDTVLKRFRELQINLVNIEKTEIGFYTDFFVDGNEKIHSARYEVQHITDPDDPDYGVVFVVPLLGEELSTGYVVPSETIVGNVDDEDKWKIDLSAFPELNTTTVRLTLLGKGRRGALQLLNTSLKKFEIANWVWVYRVMNVR